MQKEATNGAKTKSFWSKVEPLEIFTIHQSIISSIFSQDH
jgi:hypothetical protein